jgi:hypothetical protein
MLHPELTGQENVYLNGAVSSASSLRQVVRQTYHGAQGRQDKPGDEEEGNRVVPQ